MPFVVVVESYVNDYANTCLGLALFTSFSSPWMENIQVQNRRKEKIVIFKKIITPVWIWMSINGFLMGPIKCVRSLVIFSLKIAWNEMFRLQPSHQLTFFPWKKTNIYSLDPSKRRVFIHREAKRGTFCLHQSIVYNSAKQA